MGVPWSWMGWHLAIQEGVRREYAPLKMPLLALQVVPLASERLNDGCEPVLRSIIGSDDRSTGSMMLTNRIQGIIKVASGGSVEGKSNCRFRV